MLYTPPPMTPRTSVFTNASLRRSVKLPPVEERAHESGDLRGRIGARGQRSRPFAELGMPAFTLALGSSRTLAQFGVAAAAGCDRARTLIEFRVADVDREYENVRRFTQDIVQAPTTMPWGNRALLFRDPDGNLVNFFTPVSGAANQEARRVRPGRDVHRL